MFTFGNYAVYRHRAYLRWHWSHSDLQLYEYSRTRVDRSVAAISCKLLGWLYLWYTESDVLIAPGVSAFVQTVLSRVSTLEGKALWT
jgi:hypothetical protein